mmetsp:Transcript_6360/g.19090  ORF Transcript_6360/g.19090 Transcript_6360/m.19090 type:complete len:242 (-) Transcript_6360:48-773(-)
MRHSRFQRSSMARCSSCGRVRHALHRACAAQWSFFHGRLAHSTASLLSVLLPQSSPSAGCGWVALYTLGRQSVDSATKLGVVSLRLCLPSSGKREYERVARGAAARLVARRHLGHQAAPRQHAREQLLAAEARVEGTRLDAIPRIVAAAPPLQLLHRHALMVPCAHGVQCEEHELLLQRGFGLRSHVCRFGGARLAGSAHRIVRERPLHRVPLRLVAARLADLDAARAHCRAARAHHRYSW